MRTSNQRRTCLPPFTRLGRFAGGLLNTDHDIRYGFGAGCLFFILTLIGMFGDNDTRPSSLEPLIVRAGVVSHGLPNQYAAKKTKADVTRSVSGERWDDNQTETDDTPKRLPRKSLPGNAHVLDRAYGMRPGRSVRKPKEAVPVSSGRTASSSPANCLAQETIPPIRHSHVQYRQPRLSDMGMPLRA